VGPVLAGQEDDATTPKALALKVLDLFDSAALPSAEEQERRSAEVVTP
jgi:DEAD/DEAH box helicase domain-containing protein